MGELHYLSLSYHRLGRDIQWINSRCATPQYTVPLYIPGIEPGICRNGLFEGSPGIDKAHFLIQNCKCIDWLFNKRPFISAMKTSLKMSRRSKNFIWCIVSLKIVRFYFLNIPNFIQFLNIFSKSQR